MRRNRLQPVEPRTHEGARAVVQSPLAQLQRAVLSCLLWEDTFYEAGESIADRIAALVPRVEPGAVGQLARQARQEFKLRHAPLWLAREMARYPGYRQGLAELLYDIIQRPDELTEFLALYWLHGRQPLAHQVKRGLARALTKFDEYQLAKYNRSGRVRLRDVLRLCHPRPLTPAQGELWRRLLQDRLAVPDTWEVALSACRTPAEKRQAWERLIRERRLGALAYVRNLRNMLQAGVDLDLVRQGLGRLSPHRLFPFQLLVAAQQVPSLAPELERLLFRALEGLPVLPGRTAILVDVSGSMDFLLSRRGTARLVTAAAALAVLCRERCAAVRVYAFNHGTHEVSEHRGLGLYQALQDHLCGGTDVAQALRWACREPLDRLILISDEQSRTPAPDPGLQVYAVNVAAYRHGIAYDHWVRINGFSEAVLQYIFHYEQWHSALAAAS